MRALFCAFTLSVGLLLMPLGCADSVPFGAADGGAADHGAIPPPPVRDGLRSGRRLKILYAQGLVRSVPDGSQIPVGLRDEELGAHCYEREAADGKRRCVPEGAETSSFYADAACTVPLYAVPVCLPTMKYTRTDVGCGVEVHRAVPFVLGMNVYRPSGLACDTVPVTAFHKGYVWYVAGDRVPPEDLVEIALGVGAPQ